MTTRLRIGIAGATGFAGQELLRLLARHPHADVAFAMGSTATSAPRALPALTRIWDGVVTPLDVDVLASQTDAVFLALPEAASAEVGAVLAAAGRRVIDLSGAFRLRDDAQRSRWYPQTPAAAMTHAVYALPELHRDAVRDAAIISCPGCYPTAALLPLAPLASRSLLTGDIVIDAKSGISGAGKTPNERTHFSENHGSVAVYNVFGHRHNAEIDEQLGCATVFVPHLVPLDRGILTTIYARLAEGVGASDVSEALQTTYAGAPFVRLRGDVLPEIKHVAYTNFCDIGWRVQADTGRIVFVSVIDNLLKGAAGQAIQNFNIAFGFDERAGLL